MVFHYHPIYQSETSALEYPIYKPETPVLNQALAQSNIGGRLINQVVKKNKDST